MRFRFFKPSRATKYITFAELGHTRPIWSVGACKTLYLRTSVTHIPLVREQFTAQKEAPVAYVCQKCALVTSADLLWIIVHYLLLRLKTAGDTKTEVQVTQLGSATHSLRVTRCLPFLIDLLWHVLTPSDTILQLRVITSCKLHCLGLECMMYALNSCLVTLATKCGKQCNINQSIQKPSEMSCLIRMLHVVTSCFTSYKDFMGVHFSERLKDLKVSLS